MTSLGLTETGLPDLLRELSVEIGDPELSATTDGRSINRSYAANVLRTAAREVFDIYRSMHAPAILFANEISLEEVEENTYKLPPRFRACLCVADSGKAYWASDYAIHINERHRPGWFVGNGVLITNGLTLSNPTAIITQVCPSPAFGRLVAVSGDGLQLTLPATPNLGETSVQPDYYVGATIAIESGNAKGLTATITAYDSRTQVVTLSTALPVEPSANDYYTFLLGIPPCAIRPVIIKAAWIISRTMKRLGRDEVDFRAEYGPALKTAVEAMRTAAYSQTLRFPIPPAVYRIGL